jgi:hypothetical protein
MQTFIRKSLSTPQADVTSVCSKTVAYRDASGSAVYFADLADRHFAASSFLPQSS